MPGRRRAEFTGKRLSPGAVVRNDFSTIKKLLKLRPGGE